MLQVDLTRPARAHSERLAVVQAVAAAPTFEQETDWIEWKSALDVSTPEGAFKVARTILGFGNRDPDYAARFTRGCSYFLIGVEPGAVVGTTIYDAADVEQWMGRFIARGEPQWSFDYVEVSGKPVMFITSEAPVWGDEIFTLQKGLGKAKAGDVFVRSNGKTDYAKPHDIRRLTARAKRADLRLNVGVELRRTTSLRAVALTPERAKAYARRELERLGPVEQRRPSVYNVSGFMSSETRSAEKYRAEVREYEAKAPKRYEALAHKRAVDTRLAPLELRASNRTELNFAQTQVTLRLPDDVLAFFDSDDIDDELDDLTPPLPWGERSLYASIVPRIAHVLPSLSAKDRRIDVEDGVVVTLSPVDVRPLTKHDLDEVHLVLPAHYVGASLEIDWRATSISADGDASGALHVEVVEAVDADELVSAEEASVE
jgi:hypothetical protein